MTQMNSSTPIDFPNGKDVEIENFADLIIINCSKFEIFCLNEIVSKLNLDSNKERQFNSIILETTNLLKEYDLINVVPNTSGYFKLSPNGLLAKEKGGYFKYVEFIKNKELESKTSNVIVENYIAGDNYGIQSSRSDFIKPAIQNDNKINETKPPKRSLLEIASWFLGSIAAIIAIYEFIIKKYFY
ncbi:MAG: hypothetical protein KYX68_07910 [Flavobacterium sp.]|nr:hypothetical protein [Flavobacterium sp.]